MVVLVITIILSLAAVVISGIALWNERKCDKALSELERKQESLDNFVKGVELRVGDLEREEGEIIYPDLEGVVYDEKTSTMTVKGNIKAEGWISCETIKED